MHVDDGLDIGPSSMNRRVDIKAGRVNKMHVASNDMAIVVDENKIIWSHVVETPAEGIDPKVVGKLGVANCHMATSALVAIALRA